MLKQSIAFGFLVLLLNGCAHHHKIKSSTGIKVSRTPPTQVQQRTIGDFQKIEVLGSINVRLHGGYKTPNITLSGNPEDIAQVMTQIQHKTLVITIGKGYPHSNNLVVDINTHQLNSIRHDGTGILDGTNLQSNDLDVCIDGNGKTNLQGNLSLRHLTIKGNGTAQISGIKSPKMQVNLMGKAHVQLAGTANLTDLKMSKQGWLSLYWVKSMNLKLRLKGHGYVQLAGTVNKLDAELWDRSHFNGRYLRVTNLFIKTHQFSIAEISSTGLQHTVASDHSDIYYYNLPINRANFMTSDGAILDMRDWNDPTPQAYTQYNK